MENPCKTTINKRYYQPT